MDSTTDFLYLICGLALVVCIIAFPFGLRHNRKKDEIAFVKGYTHALEVHGLDAGPTDDEAIRTFTGKRGGNLHADTWEAGYRKALKNHGLDWSERDSQEVWHNPYVATDRDTAIRNAANTNAMAIQNAANTLRR